MEIILTIVIFIVVLGLVVYVHELGHFLAAKRAGVAVEEFGFGFPPRLFSKQWRGTLYSINAIPLGGFVKIKDFGREEEFTKETKEAQDAADGFSSQSLPRKLWIVVAGIVMNCLLAVVIFTTVFLIGYETPAQMSQSGGALLSQNVIVQGVMDGKPAQAAGLQAGDRIMTAQGMSISKTVDLNNILENSLDTPIHITLLRDKTIINTSVTPTLLDSDLIGIGISTVDVEKKRYPIHLALWQGVRETWFFTSLIAGLLWNFFSSLVTSSATDTSNFQGPVGIATTLHSIAELGAVQLLYAAGTISINVALFNLLPLPLLDGGKIWLLLIEAVRGKPLPLRVEALIYNVTFLLFIGLMILLTVRDIHQL